MLAFDFMNYLMHIFANDTESTKVRISGLAIISRLTSGDGNMLNDINFGRLDLNAEHAYNTSRRIL